MKPRVADLPSITVDPAICHGKPVVSGTRVMVWEILELLGSGAEPNTIYEAYPTLPRGAVEAVLGWAARKAKSEQFVPFVHHDHSAFVSA